MSRRMCWLPLLGIILAAGCGESELSRRKTASADNLKQIGLALFMYHKTYDYFPNNSTRNLSWRVSILPYLEQKTLYDKFKLDEPWDSPHNQALISQMPKVYLDPRFQQEGASETYYLGFGGDGGILGAKANMSVEQMNNLSAENHTFLVVEAGEPVPWTKPQDLVHDLNKPLPKLGGPKGEDFLAFFCVPDPIVQSIPANTDEKTLRCMIQWNNTTPFLPPWMKK